MNKPIPAKTIEEQVYELQEELRLLKIETSTINSRISRAETKLKNLQSKKPRSSPSQTEREVSLEAYRTLTGSRVRVVNPKTIEEITGTILKVGTLFVTIVLPNGKRLRRIASNLRLINDEN